MRVQTIGTVLLLAVVLTLTACSESVSDDVEAGVEEAADAVTDEASDAADSLADEADETAEEIAEGDSADAAEEVDARATQLAEVLRANDMNSLASAIEQVDLSEIVGDGEFTFFGPNDAAFLDLEADQLADLLSDPDQLIEVLRNHVVAERIDAATLTGMETVQTEAGASIAVSVEGDAVTVGDATVVGADIEVGDGLVHVVDGVLLP